MKNYAKKYLSLFVAVLMAVTMLVPTAVFADDYKGGETYNDTFTFTTSKDVIEVNDTTDITATIKDTTFGNAANLTYTSSDANVATVEGDGTTTAKVTAKASGATIITATLAQKGDSNKTVTATATIYVFSKYDKKFAGIELDKTLALSKNGATVQLKATPKDAKDGESLDPAKTIWSTSDKDVATVDANGLVTPAAKSGVVTITAKYACEGTPSASATIYVQKEGESLINKAQIAEDTLALEKVNDTANVTVTATMKDGTALPAEIVQQLVALKSADTGVADVVTAAGNDYGKVTAKKVGETTLTIVPAGVENGSAYDSCKVTVAKKLVEGIKISANNAAPTISDKVELTATVTAADATDKSVTWAGNSVANVVAKDTEKNQPANESKATVTFNTFGHAIITATANDGSGVVGKIEFDISGFKFLKDAMDVNKGDSFTAPYSYYGVKVSDIAFSSSDTSVATVDANGKIDVVGYGKATITAKNGAAVSTLELTSKKDNGTAVYRLYNRNSGEHFYTTDKTEATGLVKLGWKDEGIGWYGASEKEGLAVYRLYNQNAGEHHYTTDAAEKDMLVKAGWNDEGIEFYVSNTKTDYPVYRNYNPNAFANNHNFTTNVDEYNSLKIAGWKDEGVAFYAVNPGTNG